MTELEQERMDELISVLKDAPMYKKSERAADFADRYVRWFNGERLETLLK